MGSRGQDPGVQVTDGWRLLASALVGIGPAGGHGGETEGGDWSVLAALIREKEGFRSPRRPRSIGSLSGFPAVPSLFSLP